MLSAILQPVASTIPGDEDDRGSGLVLPPAYVLVDEDDNSRCIAFEWVGDRDHVANTVTHRYCVRLQTKGAGAALLGGIELLGSEWVIFAIARSPLQSGESFNFLTWKEASDYLLQQHQDKRRAKVRSLVS